MNQFEQLFYNRYESDIKILSQIIKEKNLDAEEGISMLARMLSGVVVDNNPLKGERSLYSDFLRLAIDLIDFDAIAEEAMRE